MARRFPARGFSLIEVILAVGIFAFAVPTLLALLAQLGRLGATSTEAMVAQSLPDAVRVELFRLAQADFDDLAGEIPVMTTAPQPGFALVATREGVRLHARDYLPPSRPIAVADQYFLVECWRFSAEPLRFEPHKAFLAVAVRVSWPYRVPGAAAAADAPHSVDFTVVLNR
jgi:prepilin-type N-terminal cleavage/methylation domain-containing protein